MDLDHFSILVLQLFPCLLAAGAAGAALFRYFARKWIDHHFDERLQDLKSEQDKVLRHVQSGIDRNVHRAKMLYDKEFEVIAEAWQLLDKAWLVANAAEADKFDLDNPDENAMWQQRCA